MIIQGEMMMKDKDKNKIKLTENQQRMLKYQLTSLKING